MYNYEITLIDKTFEADSIGNQVATETRETILAKMLSIGQNEFYDARTSDLKPEIKFVVHTFEYNGEAMLEYNGVKYTIIRTYVADDYARNSGSLRGDEVELTCGRRIGNGY